MIAKPGVYAVSLNIEYSKKKLKGIANLGYRPTFNEKKILYSTIDFMQKGKKVSLISDAGTPVL